MLAATRDDIRDEAANHVTHAIILAMIQKIGQVLRPCARPRVMRSATGTSVEKDGYQRIIFVLIEWYMNVAIDCPLSGFSIKPEKFFRSVERNNVS